MRYRITKKGSKYYPQWRAWYWPHWEGFTGQYKGSSRRVEVFCDSLEEAKGIITAFQSKPITVWESKD